MGGALARKHHRALSRVFRHTFRKRFYTRGIGGEVMDEEESDQPAREQEGTVSGCFASSRELGYSVEDDEEEESDEKGVEEQVDRFFEELDLEHDRQKKRLLKEGAPVSLPRCSCACSLSACFCRYRGVGASFHIIFIQSWVQPISL